MQIEYFFCGGVSGVALRLTVTKIIIGVVNLHYIKKFTIMVLKQRFSDGRTQFIDIGDDWMLIQQNAADFEMQKTAHFGDLAATHGKDVHAFICYGDRKTEPLYKGYPQWIYSNDGRLFMNVGLFPGKV